MLIYTLLSILGGMALHGLIIYLRSTITQQPVRVPTIAGRSTLFAMIAAIAFGFTLLGWSVYTTSRVDVEDWNTTTGNITYFETITQEANRGFSFSGQLTEELYYVRMEYVYAVGSGEYIGYQRYPNEQLFDGQFLQLEEAERASVAAQYPIGSEVTVYYNPDDPAEAALENENQLPFIILGLGLGTVAGMVVGVFSVPVLQYQLIGRHRPTPDDSDEDNTRIR